MLRGARRRRRRGRRARAPCLRTGVCRLGRAAAGAGCRRGADDGQRLAVARAALGRATSESPCATTSLRSRSAWCCASCSSAPSVSSARPWLRWRRGSSCCGPRPGRVRRHMDARLDGLVVARIIAVAAVATALLWVLDTLRVPWPARRPRRPRRLRRRPAAHRPPPLAQGGADMTQPFVSVIFPTYNRRDVVQRTLEHLLAQDYPPDRFEIIVADNSCDSTPAHGARARGDLRRRASCCQASDERLPAVKRNQALREARGDLVVFMNDDVWVRPDFLRASCRGPCPAHGDPVAVLGLVEQSTQMPQTRVHRVVPSPSPTTRSPTGRCRGVLPLPLVDEPQPPAPGDARPQPALPRGLGRDRPRGHRARLPLDPRGLPRHLRARAWGEHFHPHDLASACRLQASIGRGLRDLEVLDPRARPARALRRADPTRLVAGPGPDGRAHGALQPAHGPSAAARVAGRTAASRDSPNGPTGRSCCTTHSGRTPAPRRGTRSPTPTWPVPSRPDERRRTRRPYGARLQRPRGTGRSARPRRMG